MPSLCLKNGKRRWRGAVMVAGKMVRKWFEDASKDSERAAAAWEAEEKTRLKDQAENQIPLGSWTVLRWANEELQFVQARRAPATLRERKTAFKVLVQAIGPNFPLNQMGYDVAEEHLDNQESARSGNAANKDRKNLASAWKWAARKFRREGFPTGSNPWLEVERYAETRHPRYVPPMADMLAVLDSVQGQDHAMLSVILHLAARRDEVFRLTWADVDFQRGKVRLKTRKTEGGEWREDWLPMTKECRKALMAQWERRAPGQESVFVQEGNFCFDEPYKGQAFTSRQHFMRKACERAGVQPFGFHAIRHLTAGALFESGYKVSIIQRVLRHQSPRTTEVYLRDHGYDLDRLEGALEEALDRAEGKVILLPIANEKRP